MAPDLTRLLSGLMLLALAPVAAYIVERSAPIVALSLVCVLIVTASLYVMFGPSEKVPPNQPA